jgi:hypothetical protein
VAAPVGDRNPGVPVAFRWKLRAWFVREAWPSPVTGTSCTEGDLTAGQSLALAVESDHLVLFGDGIEADAVHLAWGQEARIHLAAKTLHLLR